MGGCGANCLAASQLCSIITGVFNHLLTGDSTLGRLKRILLGSSKICRKGQTIIIFERVKIYFMSVLPWIEFKYSGASKKVNMSIFWVQNQTRLWCLLPAADTPVVFIGPGINHEIVPFCFSATARLITASPWSYLGTR